MELQNVYGEVVVVWIFEIVLLMVVSLNQFHLIEYLMIIKMHNLTEYHRYNGNGNV
jgi:hypothetical protein